MKTDVISFSVDFDMFMTFAYCGLLLAVTGLLIGILVDLKDYFFKKTSLNPFELLFNIFVKTPVLAVYGGSALYTVTNLIAFIASLFGSDYGVHTIYLIPLLIFILSHFLFILIKEKSETFKPLND